MNAVTVQPGASFEEVWPAIDDVKGFLVPGQERWLFNVAANLADDATIVEIGSFLGRSTTAMAFACRGSRRRIFAVDTFAGNSSDFIKGKNNIAWEGDNFLSVFVGNLSRNGLLDFVTPTVGNSSEIGAEWRTPIDFLFIDGSHQYEDVVRDFELFLPWVKPGGIVAFHDVQPEWEGPYRAWQEVIKHRLENPSRFFSIAYGRKPFDGSDFTGTVHTIIPVHNRAQFTRTCLKTLRDQVLRARMEVHVVDDGSTDDTVAMLERDFPWVHVIAGDGNLWWTGAVARAIDELRSRFKQGDYFLLVNNDVYLSSETVEILVRESMRLNRAAIAPVALCGGNAISTGWGQGTASILNQFERQFTEMKDQSNTVAVQSLFGRCSLYPVEILDLVGNFDAAAFPHYHGDTDFGLRARAFDFPLYVTGSTCIRVREDKHSTGSHFDFRQRPQAWARVRENIMSPKSIDNVPAYWRYMSRHYPATRYRNTASMIWSSVRQWQPIYTVRSFLFGVGELERGPHSVYLNAVRSTFHAAVKLWLACVSIISGLIFLVRRPRLFAAKIYAGRHNRTFVKLTHYPRAVIYLLARPSLLLRKLRALRHNPTFARLTYYPRAALYLLARPALLKEKLMAAAGFTKKFRSGD